MMPTLMGVVIHDKYEPGVIDNELLKKSVLEQGPEGEAGRLFAEEGVYFEEVKSLRLEFMNILRIDHLWMLDSLTKLSLNHNLIEKIVNLEQLTCLIELDLSFNKIEKLENLEELVNLEVLSLCHNKITKLENMDNLEQLLIFSIADNLITDYKEATYLRQFRKLRSVSFKGNPCCKDYMCYKFLNMVLKDVIYLDYFKIKDEERFDSYFSTYFRVLEEKEEIIEKARIQKEEYDARVKHFAVSFVEYLSGPEYFETMFKEDEKGLILLKVGGDLLEYYSEYEEQYLEAMTKLVEEAQSQHESRQDEITAFKKVFNAALQDSIERSKIIVNTFKEEKLPLTSSFEDTVEAVNCKAKTLEEVDELITNLGMQYNDLLFELWKNLMLEEMTFFEQTEEMRVQFAVNITELVNKILDSSRITFGAWREMESNWILRQGEVMVKHIGLPVYIGETSRELTYLLSERDLLMDALAQSTDSHTRFIDAREDLLISRATHWKEETIDKTNRDEIQRNRDRVLEINYFIDNQRDDWAAIQMKLSSGPDAETAALLGDDY